MNQIKKASFITSIFYLIIIHFWGVRFNYKHKNLKARIHISPQLSSSTSPVTHTQLFSVYFA